MSIIEEILGLDKDEEKKESGSSRLVVPAEYAPVIAAVDKVLDAEKAKPKTKDAIATALVAELQKRDDESEESEGARGKPSSRKVLEKMQAQTEDMYDIVKGWEREFHRTKQRTE